MEKIITLVSCANCLKEFPVFEEDEKFYITLAIPFPTWCPECRMVRRWLFRNERSLYKRNCGMCGKGMISMYASEKPYSVYCLDCYHSDKWDPLSYGKEYDLSKSFFEQFAELMQKVPRGSLYLDFAENSEYANWAVYMKNCYLVFGGHHYEDCTNASSCLYATDLSDVDFSKKCETCYDSLHLKNCTRVYFSEYTEDSTDSMFLFGCRNCTNCIGCVNLRNKQYCIFNEQYTKEEYAKKKEELDLSARTGIKAFRDRFVEFSRKFPRKYAWVRNAQNSTGDDLEQTKNCRHCFSATESENVRYSFFVPTGAKDAYDVDHVGLGAELVCELISGFGGNRTLYSNRVYYSHDTYYCDDCVNSAYLFGCIGLRKKEYCILNRQYSKEEYEALVPKIIESMKKTPYIDVRGRKWTFGEFFPLDILPFCYNETVAQEYFPLSEREATAKGYAWRPMDVKHHAPTVAWDRTPQTISEVDNSILNEIIECRHKGECYQQCSSAFRLAPQELRFYKKTGLPIPDLCPNCRHYERLARRNPPRLWSGKCMCQGANGISRNMQEGYNNVAVHPHGESPCGNEFETTYAPERPEIVYCESCYQNEVA